MVKTARLFYYEEACDSWIPASDKTECIVSIDNFDNDESEVREIQFKIFMMTDQEMDDLPVD